jgi:hypothetical protein
VEDLNNLADLIEAQGNEFIKKNGDTYQTGTRLLTQGHPLDAL